MEEYENAHETRMGMKCNAMGEMMGKQATKSGKRGEVR